VPSGVILTRQQIQEASLEYRQDIIFPESAIMADYRRQNFSTLPRHYYYVDVLRECRACHRPFLFFAREQQYWYEVLRFYSDADCVECAECRRSDRTLRLRFKRYSENVTRTDLPDEELATLVSDAVFLWRAGLLRNEQLLRRLRNLARRRIPDSKATKSMDTAISELDAKKA
jgi:hypothetical protein